MTDPARLQKVIGRVVVPRLRLQAPHVILPVTPDDGVSAHVEEIATLAITERDEKARALLEDLRKRGASFAALQLGLLAPAARRLGSFWETDAASFVEVAIGAERLQDHMRFVAIDFSALRRPERPRSILLAPVPGDTHVFGVAMAAEFFRHAGWSVGFHPRATADRLAELVAGDRLDVVGIGVSNDARLGELRALLTRLRTASANPRTVFILGGEIITRAPALIRETGADAALAALQFAPARAERLVTDAP